VNGSETCISSCLA